MMSLSSVSGSKTEFKSWCHVSVLTITTVAMTTGTSASMIDRLFIIVCPGWNPLPVSLPVKGIRTCISIHALYVEMSVAVTTLNSRGAACVWLRRAVRRFHGNAGLHHLRRGEAGPVGGTSWSCIYSVRLRFNISPDKQSHVMRFTSDVTQSKHSRPDGVWTHQATHSLDLHW